MCRPDQMGCVANISLELQSCLKKCSGLQVATCETNKRYQSKDFISKLSTEYWNYKGFFKFPENFKSINSNSCLELKYEFL